MVAGPNAVSLEDHACSAVLLRTVSFLSERGASLAQVLLGSRVPAEWSGPIGQPHPNDIGQGGAPYPPVKITCSRGCLGPFKHTWAGGSCGGCSGAPVAYFDLWICTRPAQQSLTPVRSCAGCGATTKPTCPPTSPCKLHEPFIRNCAKPRQSSTGRDAYPLRTPAFRYRDAYYGASPSRARLRLTRPW